MNVVGSTRTKGEMVNFRYFVIHGFIHEHRCLSSLLSPAGFSIRADRRRNLPAISHELPTYLIEKLPYNYFTTNTRNARHKTGALDWPRFIHEKEKNLA